MKIDFKEIDGALKVSIIGRLDTNTAPEFEQFLEERYDGAYALVIDCEGLVYVSSAGLRVLLAAQKRSAGNMKLTNVGELITEVFEMTGFADILTIE